MDSIRAMAPAGQEPLLGHKNYYLWHLMMSLDKITTLGGVLLQLLLEWMGQEEDMKKL